MVLAANLGLNSFETGNDIRQKVFMKHLLKRIKST